MFSGPMFSHFWIHYLVAGTAGSIMLLLIIGLHRWLPHGLHPRFRIFLWFGTFGLFLYMLPLPLTLTFPANWPAILNKGRLAEHLIITDSLTDWAIFDTILQNHQWQDYRWVNFLAGLLLVISVLFNLVRLISRIYLQTKREEDKYTQASAVSGKDYEQPDLTISETNQKMIAEIRDLMGVYRLGKIRIDDMQSLGQQRLTSALQIDAIKHPYRLLRGLRYLAGIFHVFNPLLWIADRRLTDNINQLRLQRLQKIPGLLATETELQAKDYDGISQPLNPVLQASTPNSLHHTVVSLSSCLLLAMIILLSVWQNTGTITRNDQQLSMKSIWPVEHYQTSTAITATEPRWDEATFKLSSEMNYYYNYADSVYLNNNNLVTKPIYLTITEQENIVAVLTVYNENEEKLCSVPVEAWVADLIDLRDINLAGCSILAYMPIFQQTEGGESVLGFATGEPVLSEILITLTFPYQDTPEETMVRLSITPDGQLLDREVLPQTDTNYTNGLRIHRACFLQNKQLLVLDYPNMDIIANLDDSQNLTAGNNENKPDSLFTAFLTCYAEDGQVMWTKPIAELSKDMETIIAPLFLSLQDEQDGSRLQMNPIENMTLLARPDGGFALLTRVSNDQYQSDLMRYIASSSYSYVSSINSKMIELYQRILVYDKNGQLQWTHLYDFSDQQDLVVQQIKPLQDGGLAILASDDYYFVQSRQPSFFSEFSDKLTRANPASSVEAIDWNEMWPDNREIFQYAESRKRARLLYLDQSGQVIWQKDLVMPAGARPTGLVQLASGDLVIALQDDLAGLYSQFGLFSSDIAASITADITALDSTADQADIQDDTPFDQQLYKPRIALLRYNRQGSLLETRLLPYITESRIVLNGQQICVYANSYLYGSMEKID